MAVIGIEREAITEDGLTRNGVCAGNHVHFMYRICNLLGNSGNHVHNALLYTLIKLLMKKWFQSWILICAHDVWMFELAILYLFSLYLKFPIQNIGMCEYWYYAASPTQSTMSIHHGIILSDYSNFMWKIYNFHMYYSGIFECIVIVCLFIICYIIVYIL